MLHIPTTHFKHTLDIPRTYLHIGYNMCVNVISLVCFRYFRHTQKIPLSIIFGTKLTYPKDTQNI